MTVVPIVLMPEDDGRYWVAVPDLPGCISHGDSIEHAKANALEAVELYLEGATPTMQALADHKASPDYQGGIWLTIEI